MPKDRPRHMRRAAAFSVATHCGPLPERGGAVQVSGAQVPGCSGDPGPAGQGAPPLSRPLLPSLERDPIAAMGRLGLGLWHGTSKSLADRALRLRAAAAAPFAWSDGTSLDRQDGRGHATQSPRLPARLVSQGPAVTGFRVQGSGPAVTGFRVQGQPQSRGRQPRRTSRRRTQSWIPRRGNGASALNPAA